MLDEARPDLGSLVVRDRTPADEAAVDHLYQVAFGRPWPREQWRWREAGGAAAKVLTDGDRIVGHVWYRTFPVHVDGKEILAQTYGDLMVDPSVRGRGGSRSLIAAIVDGPQTPDLHVAFPAEHTVRLLEGAKRVKGVGAMTQWVQWSWAGPTARERIAALSCCVAGLVGRVRGGRGLVLNDLGGLSAEVRVEIDELAARSCSFAPCTRLRDATGLEWLLVEPERDWRAILARDPGGRLRGWAVYGRDAREGPGVRGRVVDLVAEDAATLRSLLAGAARRLRDDGTTVVTFDCHDPRAWSRRACRHAGFLARGAGMEVVVYGRAEVSRSPHRLENWYLTAADSDLV